MIAAAPRRYSVEVFWPCGLPVEPVQALVGRSYDARGYGIALPFDSAQFPFERKAEALGAARRLKRAKSILRLLRVDVWSLRKGKPSEIATLVTAPQGWGLS